MSKEITNTQILERIEQLGTRLDEVQVNLTTKIDHLGDDVRDLKPYVQAMFNEALDAVEERFDAVKTDTDTLRTMLDTAITKANRTHEDHLAAVEWLKRHERHLERHDSDIKQLHIKLKVA